MKKIILLLYLICCPLLLSAQAVREEVLFNEGWKFAFGHASDPNKDFGCGTEYFNYLTKANSIHNTGPYSQKFDDSSWRPVRLPHDWVTGLDYSGNASHSHGYKKVGWKYPETSVGWYRKEFSIPADDEGKHVELQFDGIFRNSVVWVNGFYMGVEPSGYATQVFDITDYLNYGGKNVVTVRADASLEEGWYYEGAGIYRNVWLRVTSPVHVATFGTFAHTALSDNYRKATLTVETEVENSGLTEQSCHVSHQLFDASGQPAGNLDGGSLMLKGKSANKSLASGMIENPHLWSCEDPYLYTLKTIVSMGGKKVDEYETTIGIREVKFTASEGFFLNGKSMKLKGVNMHQDHAGVGVALPDALQSYRIKRLKSIGCNAYRSSHHPMSPAMLDVCDREGILVIDENRLMGVNDEHLRLLERMIKRDRNHPSVVLWSVGNEEWGLENNVQGIRVAASMREYTHRLDSTRLMTLANAGGTEIIKSPDVVGYNYIVQNDVEGRHRVHPEWIIVGTEETTACGTRGCYYPDSEGRSMPSINRTDTTYRNIIERGWKFYHDHSWTCGLFYWTGFDYRGEPNPMKFPCVGSQFGLLDYCGFEKDEAYYLKSWWTNEDVLHVFPHWNLDGHEGEHVSVWVYSNFDEVELFVNGKSQGRKAMPHNGHLTWDVVYQPGKLKAIGFRNGKKVKAEELRTTGTPQRLSAVLDRDSLASDNRDVAVCNIMVKDKHGDVVPTACVDVHIRIEGNGRILGVGNGDPSYQGNETPQELDCKEWRVPTFNGLAQVIVQSSNQGGDIRIVCESDGLVGAEASLVAY